MLRDAGESLLSFIQAHAAMNISRKYDITA